MDTNAKSVAWIYYNQLLNQEFGWDQGSLSAVHPVVGPGSHITVAMVCNSVKKIESWKAGEPLEVVSEMAIAGCMKAIANTVNSIIKNGKVPKDWKKSYIINL